MSENSKIEWTDHTFNPWWGCIEVSPACDNCYARTFAKRVGLNIWGQAGETGRRFFGDKHWDEPLKWDRKAGEAGSRRRVFCASMADVFERNADLDEHRARLWTLIERTPNLDWLLLTKRPQNILTMIPDAWKRAAQPNVWYGTTVEDQHYAEVRLPYLLNVPAVVRFISAEPLLGPLDLAPWLVYGPEKAEWCLRHYGDSQPLSWVITGGESGGKARAADPGWYRDLRDQCVPAGVAFHFKQWGEHNEVGRVGRKAAGRILDGRTWDEFPATPTAAARP